MTFDAGRRCCLGAAMAGALAGRVAAAAPPSDARPWRIYAITFRGRTEVEQGFEDYFAARRIPVQISYRDMNRDPGRLPAFLDEIRATRPDLVYTWGTSVTLGVVGPYDGVIEGRHITDIPVVFTLVAAPLLARIVADLAAPGRNVTGVTHVVPTGAQMRAIAAYRPFQRLGVLYTSTERNSVVVLDEVRRLGRDAGFTTLARSFRLDDRRRPLADGAADLVHEIKAAGAQWLYLPPDSHLGIVAERLVIPAALQLGLPTFASTEQLMQAGALCGLVSRYHQVGQFTAHRVVQILADRRAPATLPVQSLQRFSYQVNMAAARQLHLPPPLPMFNYAELIGVPAAGG
jgi:putative ABC transport system substrate-binding protein